MDKQEIINRILSEVKFKPMVEQKTGGQQCGGGMLHTGVRIYHDEVEIDIAVGWHRSQIKNKELACTLFSLALEDVIK